MIHLSKDQVHGVGEFTVQFAYLEFLAIQKGYYESCDEGAERRIVGPDWAELFDSAIRHFDGQEGTALSRLLLIASDFVTVSPPGSLILNNGHLYFRLSKRDSNYSKRWVSGSLSNREKLQAFFDLLKNVRNNLLHGNKSIDKPELTAARLQECLPLLHATIEVIRDVPAKENLHF